MKEYVDADLSLLIRQIQELTDGMVDELITIRRDIHAHPELRFQEVRTAKLAAEHLKKFGIETLTGIGKTGVVGILQGGLGKGKVLGIRCDMDALPIQEKSDVPFKSLNDGVMHACGHDVHTTVLMGVARILNDIKDTFRGTVKFVFQPSEENPYKERCGALAMIDDGVLENPKVDSIISLHCWPDLNAGQVGVGPGSAMAAATAFQVILNGPQAHTATPQKGRDTILAAAKVIESLYQIASRRIDPSDSIALTINKIEGGNVQAVVGGEIRLTGTVRALSKEMMNYVMGLIGDTVEGVSKILDVGGELVIDDYYPPVVNNPHIDEIVTSVSRYILGEEKVISQDKCPMTAEDFSHFTDRLPGHYLKLGVANDEMGIRFPLHNERFNVDERCISVGVKTIASTALAYLHE
ncbi:MAG: amidohydrolase [Candidatus Latescibacteria bacterium]|nr:amidohydrolase [Candidatus Latescibacterota bacterium]